MAIKYFFFVTLKVFLKIAYQEYQEIFYKFLDFLAYRTV